MKWLGILKIVLFLIAVLICVGWIYVRSRPNEVLVRGIKTGNLSKIEKAIKAGAEVNQILSDSLTPLNKAVQAGLVETVKVLLKAGAEPNIKDGYAEQ